MSRDDLRSADPATAWWLDQIRPGDDVLPGLVHVTSSGRVYARGAAVGAVLEAIEAWNDGRDVLPLVEAALDQETPPPPFVPSCVIAAEASPESAWNDKPWGAR